MTKRIINHLKANPSYLKWGVNRLANKFECSTRTMSKIVAELRDVKANYLKSL